MATVEQGWPGGSLFHGVGESATPFPWLNYFTLDPYLIIVMFWPGQNAIQGDAPKKVTHSNGSYEGKSRGRKLADEMGRGKKKVPLYSHRLTHWMRVTSELHDSYFCSMTITQAIPKIAEVTHPDRQISEEIVEACPYYRVESLKVI